MRGPDLLALGILVLATGCGAHSHLGLGTGVDHESIYSVAAFDEAMSEEYAQLTVLPTVVREQRVASIRDGDREYPFSPEIFDHELEEFLLRSGGFDVVKCVQSEDDLDAEDVPRDGLLLQVEIDSQSLTYIDDESSSGWTIAMWYLMLGIPAWWVHDQTFELHFEGRAVIRDRASGRVVKEVDLGSGSSQESLNFHERGESLSPYLWVFVIPPPTVTPSADCLMHALAAQAMMEPMQRLTAGFQDLETSPVELPPEERVIAINLPQTAAVSFEFREPHVGAAVESDTLDITFDLVFPRDSRDLAWVSINGTFIVRYDDGRPIPIQKRMPIEEAGVAFDDDRIRISVKLFSRTEPIRAEIAAVVKE